MNKYIVGACIIIVIIAGGVYYSTHKNPDQKLLAISREVLTAIKNENYKELESLVSLDGLSWDNYISIDFKNPAYHFSKDQISLISTNSEKRLFGYKDGSGAPIMVTSAEYMKKYVYHHDYLDAVNTMVTVIEPLVDIDNEQDRFVMRQTDLFGGLESRVVVAYHYTSPTAKDNGDYSTIYLIFDTEKGEFKLRGIARYYWTI